MNDKHLTSGYALDPMEEAVYHFRHVPRVEAEESNRGERFGFIVETVVWVEGEGEPGSVHKNEYYAPDMMEALLLALTMQRGYVKELHASPVTGIRPASEDEAALFKKAKRRKRELMKRGLSDEEVKG